MAAIAIEKIEKSFGATTVLRDVSLDIADGEFLTLLGPSGRGKSTLLSILAGLELQTGGSVSIGNKVVDGVRPKRRDRAMAFQSYALFSPGDCGVDKNLGAHYVVDHRQPIAPQVAQLGLGAPDLYVYQCDTSACQ